MASFALNIEVNLLGDLLELIVLVKQYINLVEI